MTPKSIEIKILPAIEIDSDEMKTLVIPRPSPIWTISPKVITRLAPKGTPEIEARKTNSLNTKIRHHQNCFC
jgi:hypothetical protein